MILSGPLLVYRVILVALLSSVSKRVLPLVVKVPRVRKNLWPGVNFLLAARVCILIRTLVVVQKGL